MDLRKSLAGRGNTQREGSNHAGRQMPTAEPWASLAGTGESLRDMASKTENMTLAAGWRTRQKGQTRGQDPRQGDGDWPRQGMMEAGLAEGGWRGGDRTQEI